MEDRNARTRGLFAAISRKLALLAGSALAVTPAVSGMAKAEPRVLPAESTSDGIAKPYRQLSQKLILKQMSKGYKLVAQHDSHSSHSSHSSHASHASHSSHSSHTSSAM